MSRLEILLNSFKLVSTTMKKNRKMVWPHETKSIYLFKHKSYFMYGS